MSRKRKVTRKQLLKEPDEFISRTGQMIRWARAHQRPLTYGVGAFFLALLVIVGVRYYLGVQENRAFALLDQAMTQYESVRQDKGIRAAYVELQPEFERILKQYSANAGGKVARLFFANICHRAGEYDRAVALFKRSLQDFESDAFYRKLIAAGIGHALAGKKDFGAAAESFATIASEPGTYMKDEALFHLGHYYALIGKQAQSRKAFGEILSAHPNSMYSRIVAEKLPG